MSVAFSPTPATSTVGIGSSTQTLYEIMAPAQGEINKQARLINFVGEDRSKHIMEQRWNSLWDVPCGA